MSFTDEESNNDNINEYNDSESDSDFGDDDQKVKLLSKKQKQMNAFQTLVRDGTTHFNNSEFLNFQHDLKEINNEIIKNKWHSSSQKMPKFFVKHMLEIHRKLEDINPSDEENKKEQRALKSLKKNFKKDLKHFKQLSVFQGHPEFWKDEDSDLGQMENDEDDDADDDDDANALYSLQDTVQDDNDEVEEGVVEVDDEDDDNEDDDEDEDEDDDDDDEDEEEESSWSEWSGGGADVAEGDDDAVGSDDDDEEDEVKKEDEVDKDKEKLFGIEAFDEETLGKMKDRSFWVKKNKKKEKKVSEKQKKRLEKTAQTEAGKLKEVVDEVDHRKDLQRKKKKEKEQRRVSKWSVTRIQQIFYTVLTDRGKSSVNREQIVCRLQELQQQCELHQAEQARLTVISVLVSFYFDTASRKTTGMSGSRWRKTRSLLTTMLKSLSSNLDRIRISNDADIRLILREDDEQKDKVTSGGDIDWMNALASVAEEEGEDGQQEEEEQHKKEEEKEEKDEDQNKMEFQNLSVINLSKDNKNKKKLDPQYVWVHGNLLSFLKKLTNELWTNLKSLYGKSGSEYEKRKKNTELLLSTYKRSVSYFGKLKNRFHESEIQVLSMSVIHADYNGKYDILDDPKVRISKNKRKTNRINLNYKNSNKILNLPRSLMVKKAQFVFIHGSRRCQTSAMLYLIYWSALHNRYNLCRDLLLMSHLGSASRIGSLNVELQILYNRALAQYAICSFFNGFWSSAMMILQELYASNRIKILLAQGFTKAQLESASAEQIKLEQLQQQRMLAPHFHIHNDLLESAHLLSALFIEIPNMCTNSYNKSFIRNQYFRKVWHQYLRRDLRVPPENTKDYILTTTIAMQNGEWRVCKSYLAKLKLWNVIKHPQLMKKRILKKVKRECLRCYLYRYGSVYHNISIAKLAQMFALTESNTKQFIAKLIITAPTESKFASIDELTQCIVMHQTPPQPIQRTALEYSDKLSYLIEQNEKLLGIFSRYSSYQGGSGKGKGGKKYDKKGNKWDKKGGNKWDKNKANKANKTGNKSRFNRGFQPQMHSNQGNNKMKSNAQFGRQHTNTTQLRSMAIRPQRK